MQASSDSLRRLQVKLHKSICIPLETLALPSHRAFAPYAYSALVNRSRTFLDPCLAMAPKRSLSHVLSANAGKTPLDHQSGHMQQITHQKDVQSSIRNRSLVSRTKTSL